jgi:hypothetical protein
VSETSSAVRTAPASASRHRRRPAATGRAEREDQHGRHRRADEREHGVRRDRRHAEEADRAHDGERRAGVDPEDPRLGERVAGRALHQRAGGAERGADDQPELRPRDAQVAHDGVGVTGVVVRERPDHLAEGSGERPEGERAERAEP